MIKLSSLNKTQLLALCDEREMTVPATATRQELIAILSEVKTVSTVPTGFSTFSREELLSVAEEFAVEVNPHESLENIVATLDEFGVDFDLYKSMHPDPADLEEIPEITTVTVAQPAVTAGEKILLKMTRKNSSFEIRGSRFTRENPFALVREEDADYIIDVIGGFEVARPSEVAKYYA